MVAVKRLSIDDIVLFKETLIRFLYESKRMANYMDSYTAEQAKAKYEELLLYSEQSRAIVFGAILDNSLVGFLWSYTFPYRDDKHRLYVSTLHIDESFRSKGFGAMLLKQAEDYAVAGGFDALYLHAEASNDGAVNFYLRNGLVNERIQFVKRLKNN